MRFAFTKRKRDSKKKMGKCVFVRLLIQNLRSQPPKVLSPLSSTISTEVSQEELPLKK